MISSSSLEPEYPRHLGACAGIRRMGDAIRDGNLRKIEGTDTFDASDVDTELARVRAALMVGIDPAGLAEIVFSGARMKLITRQIIFALDKFDIRQVCRGGDRTPHPAIGARTATDGVEFVRQPNAEPYGTAVACCIMLLSLIAHYRLARFSNH